MRMSDRVPNVRANSWTREVGALSAIDMGNSVMFGIDVTQVGSRVSQDVTVHHEDLVALRDMLDVVIRRNAHTVPQVADATGRDARVRQFHAQERDY